MNKNRIFILMLIFMFILMVSVTGCQSSDVEEPVDEPGDDVVSDVPAELMEQVKAESGTLYIYDWAEWWPEEVFDGFSEEFEIRVVRDHFADSDEMLTKFRLNPEMEYDLAFTDNRAFMQMKDLDVLQPMNHDWLPNVNDYMLPQYMDPWFDPGSAFGIITDATYTGYVYNTNYVDEDDPRIGSWALLFEGEEYAGSITMLNSMYEVIGAALKYLGYSWNSVDEQELMEAKELLLAVKPNIMAFDSWPAALVFQEEAIISHVWVGEGWFFNQELESIRGVLPEEGSDIVTDSWVIPVGSQNPATAHLFINYMFRPDVYALIIETIGYSPVHSGVNDLLPPEMFDWPGVSLTAEQLEKFEYIDQRAFTGVGLELRSQIWEELKQ